MGSMATSDVTKPDNIIPKEESLDALTPSSDSASPEPDSATVPNEENSTSLDPPPVPKRKGGRKPIYATSEERKQRNRQAQAAFRERRTEYIKQLETTIAQHEETLASLQQSHRTAADECLMLRYKNSLLERILLEKGIDVQAELRLKGSPHLRPIRHGGMTGQASPMQKAMLNRQQQARQRSQPMAPPPIQTVNGPAQNSLAGEFGNSPNVQPTPPSQHSSPTAARSPAFALHAGMTSPTSDVQSQQSPQHFQPHQRPIQPMQPGAFTNQQRSHLRSVSSGSQPAHFGRPVRPQPLASAATSNYYPTSFQKHYDQLDQEYDAQVDDMLDDMDGEDMDPDSFIPNFRLPPNTSSHGPIGVQASPPTTTTSGHSDAGINLPSIPFDYDPMLDADPFGLTASMHFPNPFQGSNRGR